MLNVLFGIIIDTFATLRDEKSKQYDDMVNKCFICNYPRLIFQKYCPDGGMAKHISKDHYAWNYAFYMVHLYTLDVSDHNGDESFVFQKFESKDMAWVPAYRALCVPEGVSMDEGDGEGEEDAAETEVDMNELYVSWGKGMAEVNKQLDALLEKKKLQEDAAEKKKKAEGALAQTSQILTGEVDRSQLA